MLLSGNIESIIWAVVIMTLLISAFIGTYVLNNAQMGSGIGMGVGLVGAIIFLKKGGKQIDNMPTKEKTKKNK